jgi:hypothetical protein
MTMVDLERVGMKVRVLILKVRAEVMGIDHAEDDAHAGTGSMRQR